MLRTSVDSRRADDSLCDNIIGGSRGDDGRRGIRSQYIIHYSFHNAIESVDGDGRTGYISHNIPSPSHNAGNLVIFWGFYIDVH